MIPKFRAWDKLTDTIQDVLDINFIEKTVTVSQKGIVWYKHDNLRSCEDVILMQYTGLYDVNGNRYCQDDLVKWNSSIYRLIRGTYAFKLYGFYYQMQDDPWDYFSEGAYLEGEIIGNIYANPELLSSGIE